MGCHHATTGRSTSALWNGIEAGSHPPWEVSATMPTYLVEWYLPAAEHAGFRSVAHRLAAAVAGLAAAGTPVSYLGAALSRPDETAFCVLEAPGEEVLAEAGRRAGLCFHRISEALYAPATDQTPYRHDAAAQLPRWTPATREVGTDTAS
jgi:hypothetical protein